MAPIAAPLIPACNLIPVVGGPVTRTAERATSSSSTEPGPRWISAISSNPNPTRAGHGGRIDLLCYDRKKKRYLVIELKNVRAGQNTFAQIATYLGWVQQRLSNGKPADGLVIARGFDNRFLSAAETNDRISHLDLQELGFE